MEIGRVWQGGSTPTMTEDDLDGLVDARTAQEIRAAGDHSGQALQGFPVLPEHWDTVQFLGNISGGCWRYVSMGRLIGLDYQQIEVVMRLLNIKRTKRRVLFEQLQWVERGVMSAVRKKAR